MGAGPVRVVVVDDQQVMREGLVALLELLDGIEVVAAAADGRQALEVVEHTGCDVVLMDLRMPVLDGTEATRRLRETHPHIAVLVLTTYSDDDSITGALRAGARGYLTKDAGRAEIDAALRAAATGQATFSEPVSRKLVSALDQQALDQRAGAARRPAPPTDGLTARETEVLGLIGNGLSNSEIAERLFIGETTVKTHINNAFAKIGARHRAEAVRYAYHRGLVE